MSNNNKPATAGVMRFFRNIGGKKGTIETAETEVATVNQHPIPFPNLVSSLQAVDDVISSIQPLPSLTPKSLSRATGVSEVEPGAYPVDGPRSRPSTGRTPDTEGLGLEFAPTSQNDTDHDEGLIPADISNLLAFNFTRHNTEESTRNDDGLIHADPVDGPENGEIATAEPITANARRLRQKKLCLDLSLLAIVAIVIVSIILLAFLLAPKSSTQTQNPIQENPGTIDSITQAPTSLLERLNLPEYTLRAMENPRSPQAKAYHWLSSNINKSNNTQHLPAWRLKQRFALTTFYYSTRGEHWVNLRQGWLEWDSNECDWERQRWILIAQDAKVACNDDGQLLSLQFFSAINLDGTLPPEIFLLHDSLQILTLYSNLQLEGSIPTEVGLMTRLTSLLLSTTHLSGILPTELGQLQSLEKLLISGSKLVGTLPAELGNLSNLTDLGFDTVNFSGSIPTEILQLSNLKTLSFSDCPGLEITSFLTEVVGNPHNLEMLSLGNRKTGGFTSIPSEIGKLTNLAQLLFSDFQLNGTIPSEIGLLTKLNYLDLEKNSISGTLPEELLQLSQLRLLNIKSNKLEGKILDQGGLHQLSKLWVLQIHDNLFSGYLATEVGLMSSLDELELQNTNLSGTLPTELLLLAKLTNLVLMNTSLAGSIPHGLCNKKLLPQEEKCFRHGCYGVPTTNLSACYGTNLCGCSCDPCSN
ncbi:Leucine Rich Repeat [Seminavis robusta]|uniref:Leucine Rich Repeat n=1 Tax=Seminavis robusta TaxID=568900 RepID=A0A9N8E1A3_9STRA|nr:Leucine Rich Repeat [Seminavis robusta]|eukprot:Sro548_g164370.1 Leucine Rich Repeat (699) ;mRNA; r:18883-21281